MTEDHRAPSGAPAPWTYGAAPPAGEALPAVTPGARRVLDLVARCEGTTDVVARRRGFASGYDVPFNYGRSGPRTDKPLSGMTLDEVAAFQAELRKGGSSAVGRYQLMAATLRDLQRLHGLSGGAIFDGLLQDRLARSRMQRRKFDAYCAGLATADEAMDALAAEWASLPMGNGRSRYDFEGKGQPVGVTRGELATVLEAARRADEELFKAVGPSSLPRCAKSDDRE